MRRNDTTADTAQKRRGILDRPPVILFAALVGIGFGIFFLFFQNTYKPIPREQAEVVTGEFEKYETADGYCGITLQDGTYCLMSADTVSSDLESALTALEKGTMLHILINPRSRFVIEIRTDTAELLNLDAAQRVIRSKKSGSTILGVVLLAAGLLLVPYAVVSYRSQRRQDARRLAETQADGDSTALHPLHPADNGKTLLAAEAFHHNICYRKAKHVYMLAIDGTVYDELKTVLSSEHRLFARLDGHLFFAGFDEKLGSYIEADGKILKKKRRFF